MILMLFVFLSRIGVYLALYLTMQEVTLDKFYCNAVYKGGLYIIQGVLEFIYFLVVILMIRSIIKYIYGKIKILIN